MIITDSEVNNIQPVTFRLHRQHGREDYLFVLFKSPAKVMVNDVYEDVDKDICIFFDKYQIQSYFPCAPHEFLHDYMHFDLESDYEKMLFSSIPKGMLLKLSFPDLISNTLSDIRYELKENFSEYKNEILTNLGMVFLYRIKSEINYFDNNHTNSTIFHNLYQIRLEIYRNPQKDWSIDSICAKVCMSRSYFQHLYKKFFTVSCTQDVICARITAAKTLLLSSDYRVNEIAQKCGYQNITHFNRQFRNIVGISPEKFRR